MRYFEYARRARFRMLTLPAKPTRLATPRETLIKRLLLALVLALARGFHRG